MADRQQNINIKFNTNAVDLEKATALLNKAKAANDALNQSINKTGTQGTQDVKRFSSTIEGLRLQMQQLKAQIDLTNQSDKSRLDQLRGQYAAMSTQLKQYQGQLQQTQVSQKSLVDGLGGLYSAVRIALTAGLIAETSRAVIEMAKLKGQVDGVTNAFNKLPNATLLMADLKAKTHGTLDELTLMQKAVQAKNFKIPLEQLGTLLEFAAIKAQQTGLDINYLTNAIITGLGRESLRVLDNLQISQVELKEKTKELGSVQAATFAIVNKQMKDMGGFLETDAVKVDQLSVAFRNLQILLAEKQKPGGFLDFLIKGVEGFTRAQKTVDELRKELGVENAAPKAQSFFGTKPNEAALQAEIDKTKALIEVRKEQLELTQKAEKEEFNSFRLTRTKLNNIQEQVKSRKDQLAVDGAYLEMLKNYVAPGGPQDEQLGIVERLNEKVKEQNEIIEKSTDVTGKEQQAAIKERTELERLIAVYTLSKDELDKYVSSMDKGVVSSKSFRKEIDEQMKAIAERLAKSIKPPPKGMEPAGGFMGPNGPAGLPSDGGNSVETGLKTSYDLYMNFWDKLKMGFDDLNTHIRKGGEETAEDQRRNWQRVAQDIANTMSKITEELLIMALVADIKSYDDRITASEAYYQQQVKLAGDNTKAKEILERRHNKELVKLEKERGEAAKQAALTTIIITTAVAAIKAFATAPNYIIGVIEAALVTAAGAVEYAKADSAHYAEGVIDLKGPGTGTSDSIHAKLSKGESVMTAQETRESMGILKAIRAKKINDGIISEIFAKNGGSQQGYDFRRLENLIREMPRPSDVIKIGSMTYEAKEKAKGHREFIRNKYLG